MTPVQQGKFPAQSPSRDVYTSPDSNQVCERYLVDPSGTWTSTAALNIFTRIYCWPASDFLHGTPSFFFDAPQVSSGLTWFWYVVTGDSVACAFTVNQNNTVWFAYCFNLDGTNAQVYDVNAIYTHYDPTTETAVALSVSAGTTSGQVCVKYKIIKSSDGSIVWNNLSACGSTLTPQGVLQ